MRQLTAFGNKQKAGVNDVTVGPNAATKFRFTPDEPIEVGASVKVVGEKGILTYNGIEMAAFESGYVLVPETVADPITALYYNGIKEIEIGATLDLMPDLTITGSEGTLTFKAKTPTVATVDANGVVTALSGGIAYFEISCGTVKTMAAVSVKEAPHTHSFTEEYPLWNISRARRPARSRRNFIASAPAADRRHGNLLPWRCKGSQSSANGR